MEIKILIGLAAFIHCYIFWFEMFAWGSRGEKVFKNFPDNLFEQTKELAAFKGLYNGFLAAGLICTFFIDNTEWSTNILQFFLVCVSIAGIYGALTAEKKIFFIQSLPTITTPKLILLK